MKVLHTSDWHLGMTFRGRSIEEDQRFFIDRICELIVKKNIDAVLLAGDVFDRSIAHPGAIKLYDETVTRICNDIGVPMIIVSGNHDGAERLASCSTLLKKSGLYITGALSDDLTPVEFEDTDIYSLPWFTTEKVRAVFGKNSEEIPNLEVAYEFVCGRIKENFNPKKKNILLGHAFIVQAETSVSDRAAEVGFAMAISSKIFEDFAYVALGHIHGPQDIGKNIRYSGTPMAYSFGREEKQEKSVTIIDTGTMQREIVPIPSLYGRMTVRGKYDDVLNTFDMSERERNSYMRIEVDDVFVGFETVSRLQEIYPNLLEITGKSFDGNDSKITMSIEELEIKSDSPMEVFKRFYEDTCGEMPSEHFKDLFYEAIKNYEKGGTINETD